ncbi:sensor histidine kinase [Geochorda subterranea]|uniref:histidine kinase n=1 Tax=Geochorda subterranea TaxID=3109564 RepID=A0ABZ1BQF6_9FIRM|nr:HAMP domain-containing sensor histidine kinase [Limnochorda sp. LNt]WRP14780.1 HAMP domain-containing sensor histidine kinase [Limnochorda sp. LNt]
MNRIAFKMAAAFALVAVLSVAAVGLAAHWAVQSQFGHYLFQRQAVPRQERGAAGEAAPPPPSDVPTWMLRRTMGPRWSEMLRLMMGLPERRFLDQVRSLLWTVGGGAALAGAGLGVLMASTMSRRLRELAGRALALAQAAHQAPPARGDEVDQLAEAFDTMEAALARKEAQRRRLLADIAHELKTPLAVVQANLESMLDEMAPPRPERIAALHTQVAMLSRLVNDLRDLALAEAGELSLHRRPTDLAELLEQAADLWRPRFEEMGARLVVEHETLPKAWVDGDRIGQVLANLLSNAVRHLPGEGGWVRLRLRAGGTPDRPEAIVTVEDNGPGIPPESLPYLFDHLFRADHSRSRQTGGSGIGLSVVKSVVQAHGGRVWAANRPEGGAAFGVVLPLRPVPPAPAASSRAPSAKSMGRPALEADEDPATNLG